jgi:hypothetical protein
MHRYSVSKRSTYPWWIVAPLDPTRPVGRPKRAGPSPEATGGKWRWPCQRVGASKCTAIASASAPRTRGGSGGVQGQDAIAGEGSDQQASNPCVGRACGLDVTKCDLQGATGACLSCQCQTVCLQEGITFGQGTGLVPRIIASTSILVSAARDLALARRSKAALRASAIRRWIGSDITGMGICNRFST